ncbi:hypothetical protein QTP70_000347 [Hemibagrus guttatus]|uniref:ribonuclease H n=1 Tax=Hemibagrus guttatus TaxID=175788 RepID=A0AAE0V7V6_9TELE|nr:hypothetical protein QTP70_000347 [Hemibagrus guttatus]
MKRGGTGTSSCHTSSSPPQASTGFTTFELLFGRQHRGLLDVAREAWEGQHSPFRSVIDYVQDMQTRIDRVGPIVREHMKAAKRDQQQIYNRPAHPIVVVPKPNGYLRLCNDFRKLNQISEFDSYPLPRVDNLIEHLRKARFVSTLDLTKGYWQLALAPDARPKTAFSTSGGHWQYRILPFGLRGAPATFQHLMDIALRPYRTFTAAYLDDVLIHSSTWVDHLFHLREVLSGLQTANPQKCHLGLTKAQYPGYCIGQGLLRPQDKKVEAIRKYTQPTTKKQVLWMGETKQAFQELKTALTSRPMLRNPNFNLPFSLHTIATDTRLGAVLSCP